MCGGGGGDGGAAARAEQQRAAEAARQGRIDAGQKEIDTAFEQFNDDYYGQRQTAYTDHYIPQLDQQYEQTLGKLRAALAGRGQLESSYGASEIAKLAEENAKQKTLIQDQGREAGNDLRRQVESEKSNLYSLNRSSADPDAMKTQAMGAAATISSPPAYSPLGQVFAGALDTLSSYNAADRNSVNPRLSWNQGGGYASGRGSGRVVGG